MLEVPVRAQFPLSPLPEPYPGGIGHSMKHPSGTLALAERLHKLNGIECDANVKADSDGDGRASGSSRWTTRN